MIRNVSACPLILLLLASVARGDPTAAETQEVERASDPQSRPALNLSLEKPVECLAFSPDGNFLASGSEDYLVRIWDTRSGKHLHKLSGHKHVITSLAFSPQGTSLVSTGPDRTMRLWSLKTGKEERVWEELDNTQVAVRFSADGKQLASASWGGPVYLWDSISGKRLSRCEPDFGGVGEAAFSPDLRLVAQGSGWSFTIRELSSGKTRHCFERTQEDWWHHAAFSPDRQSVAVASAGTVELFDLLTMRPIWHVRSAAQPSETDGRKNSPRRLAFCPDGKLVVAANELGDSRTMSLIEVATGQLILQFEGHPRAVCCLAVSPNGRRLASGGEDNTVRIRDIGSVLFKAWPPKGPLSVEALKACWEDLAAADSLRAYQAVYRLAAQGKQAVPFLQKQLTPLVRRQDEEIARLIASLDARELPVRRKAHAALRNLDDLAIGPLREVLKQKPTLELDRRIRDILDRIDVPLLTGPQARASRATAVLELIGSAEAQALLRELGQGPSGTRLTVAAQAACQRLTRRTSCELPLQSGKK